MDPCTDIDLDAWTTRVYDATTFERVRDAERRHVADLRARVEEARQTLFDTEAHVAEAEALRREVGALVLEAHHRLDAERSEADRLLATILEQADAEVDRILMSARVDLSVTRAVLEGLDGQGDGQGEAVPVQSGPVDVASEGAQIVDITGDADGDVDPRSAEQAMPARVAM